MSKPSAPAGIRGWDSLKIQLALASTAMFVVVVLLLTSTQVYLIRQSLRATMGTEQTSLVNREAAEIDDKLGLRRATLTRAAANVTPEVWRARTRRGKSWPNSNPCWRCSTTSCCYRPPAGCWRICRWCRSG